MKVAAILLLAALAGVVVYVMSLRGVRGDERATAGSAPPSSPPPMFRPAERWWQRARLRHRWPGLFGGVAPKPEPGAFAYVPAGARGGTPLRTRLIGIFGLVLMVAVCSVALAAALWEIGHLVNQGIADYLNR